MLFFSNLCPNSGSIIRHDALYWFMHEMSIAMNIIEIAVQAARRQGAVQIKNIEVEVGSLAGVTVDSLEFCFEAACRNTPAQGANLQLHIVQACGRCSGCGLETSINSFFDQCPECGGFINQTTGGKELRVLAVTVD